MPYVFRSRPEAIRSARLVASNKVVSIGVLLAITSSSSSLHEMELYQGSALIKDVTE